MTTCHHCRRPLARVDAHDLKVMRPVHKACYQARLDAPKRPRWGRLTQLPPLVRRMLGGAR